MRYSKQVACRFIAFAVTVKVACRQSSRLALSLKSDALKRFPVEYKCATSSRILLLDMLDNLNLKEDTAYTQEERIPDSIEKELDYWEKVVFSFDMDPNSSAGGSSSSSGANDPASQRGDTGRRRQDSVRLTNPSSAPTGAGDASLGSLSTPSLQQLLSMHAQQGAQRTPPPLAQNQQQPGQTSMLDPYTLAHLAALSALVSPGAGGQPQSLPQPAGAPGSQTDPYAVLRQVQSLLYPYGPPTSGSGPSPPLPSMPPNYQPVQSTSSAHTHSRNLPPQIPDRPGSMESSTQPWPPYPSSSQMYPPLDPALLGQYPHLSPLIPGGGHTQQTQTPGAGPSSIASNRRSPSVPAGNAGAPLQAPTNQQIIDETAVAEDKRRRNTAASGKVTMYFYYQKIKA